MYSPKCGLEQSSNATYCFSCGEGLSNKKRPMDFTEFLDSKRKARTNFTKRKKDSKKIQVTVYGSVMKADLKQDRGIRLPIIVEPSWGSSELKTVIYEKMCRYHKHVGDFEISDYKLVYKTGESVKFIPGTKTPFTVEAYKADLGVGYQNLTFYLMLYEISSDEDIELPSALNIRYL